MPALLLYFVILSAGCQLEPSRRGFQEAEGLLARGAYKEAADAYARVVTSHPESAWAPKSQRKIAYIYNHHLKDVEKAVYSYSALFLMYPGSPEALAGREELAELYSRSGEHRSALEEYQKLYELIPEKRQMYQYLIAHEYIKMGDLRQARVELVELNNMVTNPGLSPGIRLHIAHTYYMEGMYAEALQKYGDVIKRFPENEAATEAALGIARVHEDEGRYGDAIAALEGLKTRGVPGVDERIARLERRLKKGRAR